MKTYKYKNAHFSIILQQSMYYGRNWNIPAGHVIRQKYVADRTDATNCCHLEMDDTVVGDVSRASPPPRRWDWRRLVLVSVEIWVLTVPTVYTISLIFTYSQWVNPQDSSQYSITWCKVKQLSLSFTPSECRPLLQQCIRSHDLDFWPWPWNTIQQCPLTWWIFVPSFVKIPPLRTDILHHVQKNVFDLAMTLNCDLWSWKPFQQWQLILWIMEIMCHAE